jgi:predicted RNase H-like HicB family nuclease
MIQTGKALQEYTLGASPMPTPTEIAEPLVLNVVLEEEAETARWIADVVELPGVLVYGATGFEAVAKAKLLAIDVIGDRLANGEDPLTGCEFGETCSPFEAAVGFGGIEFHHVPLAG